MKSQIDIILPVYKEEKNIKKVLDGIKRNVKTPHTINLVYYSKEDTTIPVVNSLKGKYRNLNTFINEFERGLMGQYKTGFKNTSSSIIVVMMSDLSDNPKDIDKMYAKISEGYDFVCASRYIRNGRREGGSKLKSILSSFAGRSLYLLTGVTTHDSTNAFKCFKREIIGNIKLESKEGYEMPLELVVKSNIAGYKIGEIPTRWTEREKGYSKFKLLRYLPNYLHWYFHALKHKYLV